MGSRWSGGWCWPTGWPGSRFGAGPGQGPRVGGRGVPPPRSTRWVSAAFGVLVLATVLLGVLHATGLWFRSRHLERAVDPHAARRAGDPTVRLACAHTTRCVPDRPTSTARALLRAGLVAAAGAALAVQETLTSVTGLAGSDRRATGSHEVGSHDPARMPAVIWFNDRRPDVTDAAHWPLVSPGAPVTIDSLWRQAGPIVATLDCTGGCGASRRGRRGPVRARARSSGRSLRSSPQPATTAISPRWLARLHLAVGYGGQPLRPSHGAPVRLSRPVGGGRGGSNGLPSWNRATGRRGSRPPCH